MAVAVKFFYDFTIAKWSSEVLSTFGAVFVGGAIYIAAIVLTGGLLREDLERIPMLGKVTVKIFKRIGIFKN